MKTETLKVIAALLRREMLEHKSMWRVPVILLGLAVLVKLSLSVGNLSLNADVPDTLQLDHAIKGIENSVLVEALNSMNIMIMFVLLAVASFYSLSCLYDERQDDSVLFWRSLPISDTLTIASKLLIALVVIPLIGLACQAIVAIVFLGTQSLNYFAHSYSSFLLELGDVLLWSMLPIISWCMLCSSVASKNPFLLAFVTPLVLMFVDGLFLNGMIGELLVINPLTGVSNDTLVLLILKIVFSAGCLSVSVVKRSQRI